jgi:hypothetical protein
MSHPTHKPVSLCDLMNTLLAFTEAVPCYMKSRTEPTMNKGSRNEKIPVVDTEGKPVLKADKTPKMIAKPNPFLGKVWKYCEQLIRINDSYEMAVQRRQEFEARQRCEKVAEDDRFIADKPVWGLKLDKETPSLFEWWIPQEADEVRFYMTVRCVNVQKVWYVWKDTGEELKPAEVEDLKKNYMPERDSEMTAMHQGVDKPVEWRKYKFEGVLEVTVDGTRYVVNDSTLPPCPPKELARLMTEKFKRERKHGKETKADLPVAQVVVFGS